MEPFGERDKWLNTVRHSYFLRDYCPTCRLDFAMVPTLKSLKSPLGRWKKATWLKRSNARVQLVLLLVLLAGMLHYLQLLT